MAPRSEEQVAKDKWNVAFYSFAHVAIYVASYFYYGTHPIVEIQTDPNLPVLKMVNIPGMVVLSGVFTLMLLPMAMEALEHKRKNPNFWGNLAANQLNSLTCIPTELICFPFMNRNLYLAGGNVGQIALEVVIYLMMADFWFYWTHRMFHVIPAVWQFHVCHHNLNPAKGVTAIAAASTSAIDFTITHLPMIWWPFFLRKFSLEAVGISFVFMIFWLVFIHSYSFCSVDTWIMMDPNNHRVHHSWGRKNNFNFAAFTTVYDRAFGTYRSEKEMKAAWQRGEEEEVAVSLGTSWKKVADADAKPEAKKA